MSYIVSEVYEVFIAVVTVVLLASLFTGAVEGQGRAQQPSAQASSESPGTTDRQIKARLAAKAQRTPAQRKVSSQLLDARRAAVAARRQARGAAPVDELVMVDIRADVTPAVLARIRALRGTVINSVARYGRFGRGSLWKPWKSSPRSTRFNRSALPTRRLRATSRRGCHPVPGRTRRMPRGPARSTRPRVMSPTRRHRLAVRQM